MIVWCDIIMEIMINKRYGGFGLSIEACLKYLDAVGYVMDPHYLCHEIDRTDKIMIRIVKDLGTKAHTHFSEIGIRVIDPKFEKFYEIEEYDGMEFLEIHYDKYKLHQIQQIVKDNVDDATSIRMIQNVLDEDHYKNM